MQRGYPCAAQGCESKGPFSFAKENGPFGTPRERLGLAVSSLNILYASGMGIPARGVAAFSIAIRFVSAPTIRCRSADLVGVQPNHRLSPVPTMRRAQQSRISQAVCRQTNVTRASRSKARLQHVTTRRRFMAKPCTPHLIPQAEQLFKLQATNVGGQGAAPLAFSWGSKGAILSRERMAPFIRLPCAAQGNIHPASAASTASTENSVHARSSLAACSSRNALNAASSMLSPFSV